ncbi:YcdB/YcdC domain-containing protein [Tepidibacter hydrothermalis]|uniref:S-layer homology domain-containing protein n=1 Tax=Tepidibacter hydrothermalis TaxID=3036126 RepID=A0ABY8E8P0_9FIRM|nr:YcdB/YcdC domain-containing protein [Tepidibacter hydrothermalis]WFD09278.1 S-layer homology domain-containing protein [Tepidibacter hydrothermalis]
MKNKKAFLIFFIFTFVLISFANSYADSNISKDEAKQIAVKFIKENFNIQIDDEKFETKIRTIDNKYNEKSMWDINWYSEKDIDIDVRVDANSGKVIWVDKYNHSDKSARIAKITKKEAKKIAEDFLKKINPNEFKEIRFLDTYEYDYKDPVRNYDFTYLRRINGIDYINNEISVEVDGTTGNINSYRKDWEENLNLPEYKDIIESNKAKEILKKDTNMTIVYTSFDRFDKENVMILYKPNYDRPSNLRARMVDAKKGIAIDYNGNEKIENLKTKDIIKKEKEKILNSSKNIGKLSKEINKNEAEIAIKQKLKESLNKDFELESLMYIEDENNYRTNGKKAWQAHFSKNDSDETYGEGKIIMDALTKEVIYLDLYHFEEGRNINPKLTWEEGYDKAVDIIKNYYPNKIMDIDTKQSYVETYFYDENKAYPLEYEYKFYRLVNGIKYEDNSICVNINAKTGEINGIEYNWNEDINFSSNEKLIDKDKAKDIYFDNHNIKLKYERIRYDKKIGDKGEVTLLYDLEPLKGKYDFYSLDAVSGKFIDYDGNEIIKEENNYKDKIKGHWAEKELSILNDSGIIDLKDFEDNKEITKMDAVKMLVNSRGYYPNYSDENIELKFKDISKESEDYYYIQLAVEYNLIENKEENFNLNSKLTREEMTKMIVKLIDKDKMANMKGIYSLGFKDEQNIEEDYKGYVAACKGLGIITGNDGNFRPKDNATMIEMAISIYKALSNTNIR